VVDRVEGEGLDIVVSWLFFSGRYYLFSCTDLLVIRTVSRPGLDGAECGGCRLWRSLQSIEFGWGGYKDDDMRK